MFHQVGRIGSRLAIPFKRRNARLWLDFTSGNQKLDSRITFTRASTATRINASGVLETVSTNGPRFDYDPVTLQPKGLLIEEQRTNLLLNSGNSAAWGIDGTPTVTVLPSEGLFTPALVSATQFWWRAGPLSVALTAGTSYVCSVYLKQGTSSQCYIELYGGSTNNCRVVGTIGGSLSVLNTNMTSVGAPVTDNFGNGLYRISFTVVPSTSMSFRLAAGPNSATGQNINVYGFGLEAGAFPTSYIPTTSAQVTRAADVATMTGTNFSSWYNQSEGTLFVEGETPTSASGYLASLGSGSVGTRMSVYPFGGGWGWYVRNAFVDQVAITSSVFSSGVFAKFSGAYKANDFAVSANGSSVATDTSGVVPVVDRLHIGNNNASSNFNNGHIRRIAYFPRRLTNAELQGITS